MKIAISNKIKLFRLTYLVVSILLVGLTVYLLIDNLVDGYKNELYFETIINIFALLFTALFEISIIFFIMRSMKSQTILMKNLVFKPNGTPFWFGVWVTTVAGFVCLAISIVAFCSALGTNFLTRMLISMQLFIADVMLVMSTNLLFVFAYFLLFRHESGTFEII